MKYNPDIIKSDRKTISIEVRRDGKVTIRAPLSVTYREIENFVEQKSEWIEKALAKYSSVNESIEYYTQEEIDQMTKKAKEIIPKRVEFFAEKLGVTYTKVSIRHPKTRWGSCSSKGALNFSCLLTQLPPEVLDSVVVHELCHRKEMNHSKRFYEEVLRVMPDYYEREQWLKANGSIYMRRLK